MARQPRELTDAETAALRPWRRYTAIGVALMASSYIAFVLYLCLASNRNWHLVWSWLLANLIIWRVGVCISVRYADRLIKSVSVKESPN